jgi:hypothetical protein
MGSRADSSQISVAVFALVCSDTTDSYAIAASLDAQVAAQVAPAGMIAEGSRGTCCRVTTVRISRPWFASTNATSISDVSGNVILKVPVQSDLT